MEQIWGQNEKVNVCALGVGVLCNICRVSQSSDGTVLSALTRSGADNVQRYITGIKYSEAQHNQVNWCTCTHPEHTRHTRDLHIQHHILPSKTTPAQRICTRNFKIEVCSLKLQQVRLCPHSLLVRKWTICRISEAFTVTATRKEKNL